MEELNSLFIAQRGLLELGSYPNDYIRKIYAKKLIAYSLENKVPTLEETSYGTLELMDELISNLIVLGGSVCYKQFEKNIVDHIDLVWKDGWVRIRTHGYPETDAIDILTTNPLLLEQVRILRSKYLVKKHIKGQIWTLMKTPDGVSLSSLDKLSMPFEEDNYSPQVIEDVTHIVDDLKKKDPCGKLSIIDGPPGTGKTSLIKMIISEHDLTFILVPSYQLIEWSSPALINVLQEGKKNFTTSPVFILEDADDCMVPRTSQNINAISTLLNLSDGILGSVFDLRILATTNAKLEDIDEAIMRDGRLCKRVIIGTLDKTQANRIYQRLTGKTEELFDAPVTLAEIYKATKDIKRVENLVKRKSSRIGFTT